MRQHKLYKYKEFNKRSTAGILIELIFIELPTKIKNILTFEL